MCCGFDNCYTISTIEENDIEYFEGQVRKGALAKFFENNSEDLNNVLEGSVELFEFSRGHQKLIMTIAKTVKEKFDKNGIDGFGFPETSKSIKDASACKLSIAPCKRQNNSDTDSNLWESDFEPIFEDSGSNAGAMATIHRNKLVKQAVASLKKVTPDMVKEVSTMLRSIKTKLSTFFHGSEFCNYTSCNNIQLGHR